MIATPERIQLLTEACSHEKVQQWTGPISIDDLRAWLSSELGSERALDNYHPHGPLQTIAIAPQCILHIVSGNTPHAAFQSIIRGLLIGSHNIVKIPSTGLDSFTDALIYFPKTLRELIEIRTTLKDEDWLKADVIIATGSDESIAAIHQKTKPQQRFIPHGHKVSIAIAYEDYENAAQLAARDVSLYNQQGCLSIHAIYTLEDSAHFAELLAIEMEKFSRNSPPDPISASEAGAIRNLRETMRFCASNDPSVQLWESKDTLNWTVIHQTDPTLQLSCLNRCVYVKPLPPTLDNSILGSESAHLSTIAIHPFDKAKTTSLENLSAHRICPLGKSQEPSLFWHHDGIAPIASLVKWRDIG
ncbi:MAG: acyl-CoA reductase [Akkermansiaceae bacterium]